MMPVDMAKMGRPPKPDAERLSEQLNFRVTPPERKLIEKAAGDTPVSEWIRRACLERAKVSQQKRR